MDTLKILVIDDELRFCETIRVFLTMKGFHVEVAHSVEESISLAQKNDFDLFLVDKQMPGQDGFVFMDYTMVHHPGVPFIMMTGKASIDSAILALKKGAYDYLRKPFKYEKLMNTVNNALAQRKLEKENIKINSTLQAAQKKYRDMIHNSPDLFFMLDENSCFTFINKTFETTLGYCFKNIKDKSLMEVVHEEDHDKIHFFLNDRRSNKGRRATLGAEIRMKCKPGNPSGSRLVDIEIKKSNCSFHFDEGKNHDGVELCIVGRDISYRKQFEEQLIYTQKMEAVGILAGGVAHDFNNLLMNIQGQTSIIKMGIDPGHPGYEKLGAIERHIRRGSNIAAQLLNFARGGHYDIKPANMNYIIKDTLELFSISRKNIRIHLDLKKKLWPVKVDVCQMEQVFLNLFINAHHAMPDGGELFIKSENTMLDNESAEVINRRWGKYVKLTIRDTGHGIDKHLQKKIFDPFFTTKKRCEGTGLGLASVYGIINKHQGAIQVVSEPDKGAEFIIYLYASNNRTAPAENPGNKDKQPLIYKTEQETGTGKNAVLVIDDDPVILTQSADMLEKMGLRVITAENGIDGVQKYLEEPDNISLVVLDMVMPGLNGIEVFGYIKKINPMSKILITTGYRKTCEVDDLLKDECSSFLQKPYGIEQMGEKINTLLKREDSIAQHS